MESKWFKGFKIFLILISLILSIINIIGSFKKGTINFLAFASLGPLFIALYSEVDYIYIWWNKCKAYLSQRTVSFTAKFYFLSDTKLSINDVEKKIRDEQEGLNYEICDKSSKGISSDEVLSYEIKYQEGPGSKISMQLIPQEDDQVQVVFSNKYQISYRDVKSCWKRFCNLRERLFQIFSNYKKSKSHYAIIIDTLNAPFNPFYKLTVRSFDKVEVKDFNLKFSADKVVIQSTPNKIYCTSVDGRQIEKVIKEYIPLSKVI